MSGSLGSFDITNGVNGKDGKDGAQGAPGEQGAPGQDGKDGKDGTAWTIGEDGFWYENGQKTEYYALSTSAGSTTTNVIEASPKYYVPNAVTGCFDIYQDGVKIESTSISFIGTGSITATMDKNILTLYGIAGAVGPNNSISISLNGALASLVFIPELYLDGIESIEYPWIGDTTLRFVARTFKASGDKSATDGMNLGHHGTFPGFDYHDITGELNDYQPNTLARRLEYDNAKAKWVSVIDPYRASRFDITSANLEWVYGPVWPVKYDMNPANAAPEFAKNTPSWKVLEPEVIFYNTRASASSLGVTSPQNYDYFKDVWGDNPVYGYKDGDLTVGLKIAHPDLLAPWPTDETINPNGNVARPGAGEEHYNTGNKANGLGDGEEYTGTPKGADPDGHYEWYGNNGQPSTWGNWYGDGTTNSIGTYKYNKNNKDNTLALEVAGDDGAVITSDYALIVPTRATLEALIWYQKPMYAEPTLPGYDGTVAGVPAYGPKTRVGDEEGWAIAEVYPNPANAACENYRVHIWDTPEEAIADEDGAALELGALDPAGLDLKPYLGVHACIENLKHKEEAPGVFSDKPYDVVKWNYEDVKKWGLHWEFELVEYISSTNVTSDSRYATFSDWTEKEADAKSGEDVVKDWNKRASNGEVANTSKTGIIIARNVTAETGRTTLTQSTSSVDREPLVRVTLKRNSDGKVMLDGYILLHIDNTPDNLEVKDYPVQDVEFNLCDPVEFTTNWHQFSRYILTDNLKNTITSQTTGAQILAFDEWYWADCIYDTAEQPFNVDDAAYVTDGRNGGQNGFPKWFVIDDPKSSPYNIKYDKEVLNPGASGDGHRAYQLKIFNFGDFYGNKADGTVAEAPKNGDGNAYYETSTIFENKALGDMWYDPNGEGPTNHTFHWILSEEEIEFLTHDKNEPITVTRWLRFIAKDYTRERIANNYTAPYPYIWVRCQLTITRPDKNTGKYAEKIKNYWYHWNPDADINLKDGNKGKRDEEGDGVYNGFSAVVLDIEAPRSGITTKGQMWDSPIHNTLIQNRVDKAKFNFKYGKYYFTPKTNFNITALNGKKYRVTVENKNYTQPFWILNPSKQGIIDDQCYVTLSPKAGISQKFGDADPYKKDFINSGADWQTYDKLFCRYVWKHDYANLEYKGEYWRTNKDLNPNDMYNNYTYQPMDAWTTGISNVYFTNFWPNVPTIKAGSDRAVTLADGTAIYNNDVEPEVYNKSGYGVGKTYYVDADAHVWDEKTLQATLRWCTIIYDNEEMKDLRNGNFDSEYRGTNKFWRNAGVFNDSILYAEDLTTHVYTPIARFTKQEFQAGVQDLDAGNIELIHYLPIGATYDDFVAGNAVENYACYDVLNALGYPTKEFVGGECDFEYAHRFINQQLRAWVGVVGVNDCNVAQYIQQDEYDPENIATFLASWERPINLKSYDPDYALDAKTEENYVFFIDYLKLYDWRGDKYKEGYMYDDHYWFWAYYNVKEIDVDLRDDQVRTTMHHPELDVNAPETWPTLGSITHRARLLSIDVANAGTATARVIPGVGNALTPYEFDLVDAAKKFTYAVNNDALKAYMGINPVNKVNKARFGGFYYENNGDNVTDFYVYIPVTIHYEWGKFKTHVRWLIKTTSGRNNL